MSQISIHCDNSDHRRSQRRDNSRSSSRNQRFPSARRRSSRKRPNSQQGKTRSLSGQIRVNPNVTMPARRRTRSRTNCNHHSMTSNGTSRTNGSILPRHTIDSWFMGANPNPTQQQRWDFVPIAYPSRTLPSCRNRRRKANGIGSIFRSSRLLSS